MKNVKVILKTVNIADGQREENTFCYNGRLDIKNGAHYLMYEEQTEDGTVNTIVKATDSCAVITRKGVTGSVLKIEENTTHRTEYETPYGTFLLLVRGIRVENKMESGSLSLEYTLSTKGGEIGRNIIELNVKEV